VTVAITSICYTSLASCEGFAQVLDWVITIALVSWKKNRNMKSHKEVGVRKIYSFFQGFSCKECMAFNPRYRVLGSSYEGQVYTFEQVEEWVRNLVKRIHVAFIIWKAVITTFPLVGNLLV
jgi:hypothetical protein